MNIFPCHENINFLWLHSIPIYMRISNLLKQTCCCCVIFILVLLFLILWLFSYKHFGYSCDVLRTAESGIMSTYLLELSIFSCTFANLIRKLSCFNLYLIIE